MGRKKLIRFAENEQRDNIISPQKPLYSQVCGKWQPEVFANTNPIVLELACGYGEYSVGLAQHYPNKNFIGIDIKGERLWKGSTQAIDNNLSHVRFLQTQIHHLEQGFAPNEVAEIWLIHPDPRPRNRDIRRRLTAPRFLNMYQNILQNEGWFHLKTDSDILFDYTLQTIQKYPIKNLQQTRDLYQSPLYAEHFGIQTRYEKRANTEGITIKYLKFQFATADSTDSKS
jgi:tRNA (guanine-N7-)-methyltransferase